MEALQTKFIPRLKPWAFFGYFRKTSMNNCKYFSVPNEYCFCKMIYGESFEQCNDKKTFTSKNMPSPTGLEIALGVLYRLMK